MGPYTLTADKCKKHFQFKTDCNGDIVYITVTQLKQQIQKGAITFSTSPKCQRAHN